MQDVAAEAQHLSGLGIGVRGPVPMTRSRADGRVVEWDLAFVGDGEPGTQLPFIIRDRTPRDWRVAPSASVPDGPLAGVGPGKVGGVWLFKDTRVPVKALFENLEDRARVDDFLEWFPGVGRAQVEAVLEHAGKSLAVAEIVASLDRIRPGRYLEVHFSG